MKYLKTGELTFHCFGAGEGFMGDCSNIISSAFAPAMEALLPGVRTQARAWTPAADAPAVTALRWSWLMSCDNRNGTRPTGLRKRGAENGVLGVSKVFAPDTGSREFGVAEKPARGVACMLLHKTVCWCECTFTGG